MTADELQQYYLSAGAMLYGVALGIVGGEQEAEDVVQDTFVSLWRHRDRLTSITDRDEAQRYFTQAVKHTGIDHLRRLQARPATSAEDISAGWTAPDTAPTPYDQAATQADLDWLRQIVSTLPPKQAEAFCLFHFDGLEVDEVARRMGEATSYVRVMLFRARKAIRERYLRDH